VSEPPVVETQPTTKETPKSIQNKAATQETTESEILEVNSDANGSEDESILEVAESELSTYSAEDAAIGFAILAGISYGSYGGVKTVIKHIKKRL